MLFLSYLAVFFAGMIFGILLIALMAANDEQKIGGDRCGRR